MTSDADAAPGAIAPGTQLAWRARGGSTPVLHYRGPCAVCSSGHQDTLSSLKSIPTLCDCVLPGTSVCWPVRVWWEATAPPREEDGAAFYPAKVVRNITGTADDDDAAFVLEFATGECTVSAESVFPFDNPVAFGGEQEPLQAGELVELSNTNEENPLAWLVRVTEAGTDSVQVEFPFDFRNSQRVPAARVRRSRFYESATKAWSLFQPYQAWDHGQILAPIELEFIFEKDYFQHLTEHAPAYMAALVLLEHSHSDAAAMDLQQAHAMPSPIVPAPPGQETLQQQQQQLSSEQQGTGKKGGKGRGRGVATGGKAKRRRTTASAPLDTDMSFDVVPHVAPSQTYGGHMGVPDPTVPQVPDLAVGLAPPAGLEKAYNLLSRAFVPPAEGPLDPFITNPPVPPPSSATAATQAAAAPADARVADAPQGVQLRRSSRPPRPTAAAAALAGEHSTAAAAAAAPPQPPQAAAAAAAIYEEVGTGRGAGGMEGVLMWVRPMMQRSGEHMMFEMLPAQPLPPDSWAQLLNPGSWDGIQSGSAVGAASMPSSTPQPPLAAQPCAAAQAAPPHSYIPSPSVPLASTVPAAVPLAVPTALAIPPGRPPKQSKAFPKRALNPYLVFLRKHEPIVRAEQPELNNTQVTRHLATMWRNVSAEEKEECKVVAEEDKLRYQGEVQAWARAHPDLAQGLHKPKLPTKRGMNGYVLFMKDFQARTLQRKSASGEAEGDLSNTPEQQLLNEHGQDLNAAISAAWKALPEHLRSEYKQRAQALKVGSAAPPEAAALNAVDPSSHAGKHKHVHAQATAVNSAVPAAVNIAANICGLGTGGDVGLGDGSVDGMEGSSMHAVPGSFTTQSGATHAPEEPSVAHYPPPPFNGADAATGTQLEHSLQGNDASESAGMMSALAGAGEFPDAVQLPQGDGLGGPDAMHDGVEVTADMHVSMVPAPTVDTELQK